MSEGRILTNDAEIHDLLRDTRRIAVVGLSADPNRPSYGVAAYLQSRGYEIIPVNPKHAGQSILGQPVVRTLAEVDGPIDLVDVFRRPIDVPPVAEAAIAVGAKALWLQLGIVNQAAADQAATAGLLVVQDRCIAIDVRNMVRASANPGH